MQPKFHRRWPGRQRALKPAAIGRRRRSRRSHWLTGCGSGLRPPRLPAAGPLPPPAPLSARLSRRVPDWVLCGATASQRPPYLAAGVAPPGTEIGDDSDHVLSMERAFSVDSGDGAIVSEVIQV